MTDARVDASRKAMRWCLVGVPVCVALVLLGVVNALVSDPLWSIVLAACSVVGMPVGGVMVWRALVWFRRAQKALP